MVSPLYANKTNNPSYGQLYIFDSSEATSKRLNHHKNTGCIHSVMLDLDEMLRKINPYAESYRQMHSITLENPAVQVKMVFLEDNNLDMRRYNTPTSNTEVAAIFVGEEGEPPQNREICVYPNGESCKTISPLNQNTDPMVHPLLFSYGERGWHTGLQHVPNRRTAQRIRVTQLQYFAYRLSMRAGFSILHNSGKLFQQYIVDAYVKTEASRLNFLRFNEHDLRVEQYTGLLDALESRAHCKCTCRPAHYTSFNFQGSPRYMQQNYQDTMAIVRKFGSPDLFITFKCNPLWPEIKIIMDGTLRLEHRPDIVVRVFKMKLTELLHDILNKNVFGKVIAYVYVIEFQKRGLLHAHILLTLNTNSKIRTKDDIDKFVSAEIPDRNFNQRLFEIVTKCMIHGPCGPLNPNSPCMKEGVCGKGFPKNLIESTKENVNGYPVYRRRAGPTVLVGQHEVDN